MNRGFTLSNWVYDRWVLSQTKDCFTVLDLGVGRKSGSDSIVSRLIFYLSKDFIPSNKTYKLLKELRTELDKLEEKGLL
jgi:hypothetical protein